MQAIVGPTLGNGWSCWQHVIVSVLTLAQHWTNTQVSTVEVRWPKVGPTTTHQRWILSCGAWMMTQHLHADCNYIESSPLTSDLF